MPVRTVYRDDGGVVVKGFGTVTGADLLQTNNHIYSTHEPASNLEYQLWDFLHANRFILSPQEMQILSEQDTQAAETIRRHLIAIVARQDHIVSLSCMWQSLSDNEHVFSALFQNRKDAETWLIKQRAELASYLSIL
jgi:hypothetical protein